MPEVAGDCASFIPTNGKNLVNPISLEDLIKSIEDHVKQRETTSYDPTPGFAQVDTFSWKRAGQETWKVIKK